VPTLIFLFSVFFLILDDENSHVHGVLTADNLFDGTINTATEQYYIEPSHKYSNDLPKNGIHTIIYKLSDVKMNVHNHNNNNNNNNNNNDIDHHTHCASERLFRKLKNNVEFINNRVDNERDVNQKSEINLKHIRKLNRSTSGVESLQAESEHRRSKRWLKVSISIIQFHFKM
jgi:hypothetical protein